MIEKPKAAVSTRYRTAQLAIFMSSLTVASMAYRCRLTGAETIEIFKFYAMLVGGICGVYQAAKTSTSNAKLKNGGNNG